jgi:hypothetical protein
MTAADTATGSQLRSGVSGEGTSSGSMLTSGILHLFPKKAFNPLCLDCHECFFAMVRQIAPGGYQTDKFSFRLTFCQASPAKQQRLSLITHRRNRPVDSFVILADKQKEAGARCISHLNPLPRVWWRMLEEQNGPANQPILPIMR